MTHRSNNKTYKVSILWVIRTMAEQRSAAHIDGIDVYVTTDGPEAQDGHEIGSDVLHSELVRAMEEVLDSHDD